MSNYRLKMTTSLSKFLPLNIHQDIEVSRLFYLQDDSHITSTISAFDLTHPTLEPWPPTEMPRIPPSQDACLAISRKSVLQRSFTARERGEIVATASNSVLSLGHWCIAFPADSAHCSHKLSLRPVRINSRVDYFVQDSTPYFLGVFNDGGTTALFKAVDLVAVKVAEFKTKTTRRIDGVLAIDTRHIDYLVALMACICCLKRVESWRM